MTIVRDLNGEGHAVLTVKTDHGDFVLDNLSDEIRPWTATGYQFYKRQAQDDPERMAQPRRRDRLRAGNGRVELRLLARRRVEKAAQGSALIQGVLNHSHFIGHRSRLYAIRHVQRPEERGNVDLDGLLRKTKLPTDFLVRTAFTKQPQDVDLPSSQTHITFSSAIVLSLFPSGGRVLSQ